MQRLPFVYFAPSPLHGRGVFTAQPIPQGALIEICPVIVMPRTHAALLDQTGLRDYYFDWGEEDEQIALALGFGSLYNHSPRSNARYLLDFDMETISIVAIRDIEAEEEITVNYNGDPADTSPVWFERHPHT